MLASHSLGIQDMLYMSDAIKAVHFTRVIHSNLSSEVTATLQPLPTQSQSWPGQLHQPWSLFYLELYI